MVEWLPISYFGVYATSIYQQLAILIIYIICFNTIICPMSLWFGKDKDITRDNIVNVVLTLIGFVLCFIDFVRI